MLTRLYFGYFIQVISLLSCCARFFLTDKILGSEFIAVVYFSLKNNANTVEKWTAIGILFFARACGDISPHSTGYYCSTPQHRDTHRKFHLHCIKLTLKARLNIVHLGSNSGSIATIYFTLIVPAQQTQGNDTFYPRREYFKSSCLEWFCF